MPILWTPSPSTQQEFEVAVARLQAAQAPPEVMAMCAALRTHSLALEHESVWLGLSSSFIKL